mmetsp:Transcript_51432/g.95156  ORF Transcript_51432/g.95156 Transcript_51432/m.95156 type:complete len:789 (-) Transcript_51432:14-2380(-)
MSLGVPQAGLEEIEESDEVDDDIAPFESGTSAADVPASVRQDVQRHLHHPNMHAVQKTKSLYSLVTHTQSSGSAAPRTTFAKLWSSRTYRLPRKVVVEALETLDAYDSPDRPGLLYETTLREMLDRLDAVFGNGPKDALRDAQIEHIIGHLHKHTRRRRGQQVLSDGFLEWEHTAWIHELFKVDLNVCEQVFFTIDVGQNNSALSRWVSAFLVLVILVSIVTWMVSTLPSMQSIPDNCFPIDVGDCAPEPHRFFDEIERTCVYIFTLEYTLRLLTVHSVRFALQDSTFLEKLLEGSVGQGDEGVSLTRPSATSSAAPAEASIPTKLDGKCQTTAKFIMTPSNLVDLLSIIPYWWEFLSGTESSSAGALMILRILRLTRVFRIFKLGQYNEAFVLFTRVMQQSTTALSLMVLFIILDCCLFGTLIWFTEQGEWYPEGHEELQKVVPPIEGRGAYLRPDGSFYTDRLEESPFSSIIHSFWYVIVTITTVGYGDFFPTTAWGKLVGFVTILNGIVVLAMPVGVVGANFSTEYYRVIDDRKRRQTLQQQDQTMSAVEEEQDRALLEDPGSKRPKRKKTKLHRIDTARHLILVNAQKLDAMWADRLPAEQYNRLSFNLRAFVRDLLSTESGEEGPPGLCRETAESSLKWHPFVSVLRLRELDVLTAKVHMVLSEHVSTDWAAEFGFKEALDCRRHWAAFAERCWAYVVQHCRLMPLPEPPPIDGRPSVAPGSEVQPSFEVTSALERGIPGDESSKPSAELRSAANAGLQSPDLEAEGLTPGMVVTSERGNAMD